MSSEEREDLISTIRREVERNALRARNGISYLAGGRFVRKAPTPRDLVWRRGKVELWHYRGDTPNGGTPVLLFVGLVARAYCFDLYAGNSFVRKLMAAGLDVYVLDWGCPDEAEAANTLATYTLELLPEAVRAVIEDSGEPELTIIGYCMGAAMALTSLGGGQKFPLRALVLMATPFDFSKMGEFLEPLRDEAFDPESLLDETGNVPASLIRASFRARKPTSDLLVYANLLQNLWSDEYVEGFQAMNEWANDHVPLPGGVFRDMLSQWIIGNGFVRKTMRVGGRKVDLGRIHCPVLCVIAEKDDIVPPAASEPLPSFLTGAQAVENVRLPAGHVNLVVGRPADRVTIPAIGSFLLRHAGERKSA